MRKVLPQKKYMSRAKACGVLGMSLEDFNELAILLSIMPAKEKRKQCIDHLDTVYYRISDVQKMIDSQLFISIHRRNKLAKKRELYKGLPRYKHDIVIDYRSLVINKYPSFSDAVNGLPFSIKLLYIKKRGEEFKFQIDNIAETSGYGVLNDCTATLEDFYNVVKSYFPLKKCLIGKNGFYLGTEIQKSKVEWFVPFKLEERKESKVVDVLYPLCLLHVKLVTEHLKKSVVDGTSSSCTHSNALEGMTFAVRSVFYKEIYDLVIASCNGRISETQCEHVITDMEIDVLEENVAYVQPQFVFDALNANSTPDVSEYFIGRKLPQHTSKFKEEKTTVDDNELLTLSKRVAEAYVAEK